MQIAPEIAALLGDRRAQIRIQQDMHQAAGRWRAAPNVAPVLAELKEYGAGAPLDACPALEAAVLGESGAGIVVGLSAELVPAWQAEPLGLSPLRHSVSGASTNLLLAREGRALLLVNALRAGDHTGVSVAFTDGERHEQVLAGSAKVEIVTLFGEAEGNARLGHEALALAPGARFSLALACQALRIGAVPQGLITLRLERLAAQPRPGREVRLADGAVLRLASGEVGESRRQMMLALLGRMGRREAAPLMAEMAREPGNEHLRWHALRECLALDSAVGFGALLAIARDAGDPLAGPAGALRAQLVESYPALAHLEQA